jgi:hypothetical protein
MRLERVLLGRSIRLLRICGPEGGEIYGPNLAKACDARYGFLQSPRTLEEFDFAKGVTFQCGYFRNRIVIDKFQVFQGGMLVEAKINTAECDAFLDDVVECIGKVGGISAAEEIGSARFYYSNVEVHGAFSLADELPQLHQIGREIANKLRQYHQTTVDYELVGLLYGAGAGAVPAFRFERRENAPEEARLYYSAAPLRTDDHMTLLERLDAFLTD